MSEIEEHEARLLEAVYTAGCLPECPGYVAPYWQHLPTCDQATSMAALLDYVRLKERTEAEVWRALAEELGDRLGRVMRQECFGAACPTDYHREAWDVLRRLQEQRGNA